MWTRGELKDRAKQVLRTSYWKAFLVSFVIAVIGGGIPSCSFNSGLGGGGEGDGGGASWNGGLGEGMDGIVAAVLVAVIVVAVVIALVGLAFTIFLRFPLEVGSKQYFKQAALGDVNMNYLGYAFGRGKYAPIVKGMLWMSFLNLLWFLLLIVPGIVKSYAYSMVPYLLADNPGIGTKRAVELSDRMTQGHKWRMFVLDLSFIGWYLLGALACLIGTLFVLPYVNATKAELYLTLRRNALDEGVCTQAELGLTEYV
ncbi:DUF975 family protein [Paenibacillus antri]|uniref:DUF975 family protein n=1 Tax=Paenibacillus antri TaxID=2582848 RepID=A0A5R9G2V1_9BACL|nr:DUF975 family protein [Paenibacillus antri]TLS50677.1 DUF975 family protein [Paenibacillus antri]